MENNNMTFEEAMTRLEEVVRTLESGSATLEQSLQLYEEGIALVRVCSGKLDAAEKKIKLLSVSSDGTVEESGF